MSAFLEVNLKNLIFNYKYLSSRFKGQYTGATIKANAYGLGAYEVFKVLYKSGCRHFFVATLYEAIKLRKEFNYGYLYVLNGIKKNNINSYILKNKIIPVINSIKDLDELKTIKNKFDICLHIDTGINRLGIPIADLKKLKKIHNITIKFIMTHFASANEKNNPYNNKQSLIFNNIANKYFKTNLKSIVNSAGIILNNNMHCDLARPGIALYGGHNNTALKNKIKPVIILKAEILQIKIIKKNNFIGYNQTYYSNKNMIIAIIGIGYADGILRKLSNRGCVYYKKYKFNIIGRISMDTITIDITKHNKLFKEGMLVDLINYKNDIEKLAKNCETISNEILTLISDRVKRIYKH